MAIDPDATVPDPAPAHTRTSPSGAPPAAAAAATSAPAFPLSGEVIDDFRILALLGEGAFGKVYLAEQRSLERRVALKATATSGAEARTLARFEHDHIVQVYSERVLPERGLRLIAMQYVAGPTLEAALDELRRAPRDRWDGRLLADVVASLSRDAPGFDAAALRDRDLLVAADFFTAAAWIGLRLAEALAHAHARGVLHRDIKPANIVLHPYGRPLLVDFNVAAHVHVRAGGDAEALGGTLLYMAPEHLEAFDPRPGVPPPVVGARADLYSLGVVLHELITGRSPREDLPRGSGPVSSIKILRARRLQAPASLTALAPGIPDALDRIVRRCLDPDPERRFADAADLARALRACLELLDAERALPPAGPLTRAIARRPFVSLAALAFLPHVLGSAVNIAFNRLHIAGDLTAAQQESFHWIVIVYNAIAYPICLGWALGFFVPIVRLWRALDAAADAEDRHFAVLRGRIRRLPLWVVAWSCMGWLPGGVVFPLAIQSSAGALPEGVFGHFVISFTLSGLIALTYAYFGVEYVALRVLYPRLVIHARDPRATAARELSRAAIGLRVFQVLAALIPIAGAALLIGEGPDEFTPASYASFRGLVTVLLAVGMAGLCLTAAVSGLLSRTLTALGVGR